MALLDKWMSLKYLLWDRQEILKGLLLSDLGSVEREGVGRTIYGAEEAPPS